MISKNFIDEKCKKICDLARELKNPTKNIKFKDYVLSFVFYRYISENLADYINENQRRSKIINFDYHKESNKDEDWISYRSQIIDEKGYFIAPSNLFKNVFERFKVSPDIENLNREIKDIFDEISKSSKNYIFSGLFEKIDFSGEELGETGKAKGRKILEFFDIVQKMEFKFKDENGKEVDIYGVAYESLIGMYGISEKMEVEDFYTPKEISETLIGLVSSKDREIRKVYDPACGSGSLLLKFLNNEKSEKIEFYGQEIKPSTYNMCQMNMFLHNVPFHRIHIMKGDTLLDDKLKGKDIRFDAIVTNPPYSGEWNVVGNESRLLNDERFMEAGVLAPKSKADLAFTLHSLYYLEENNGIAAIVCFPGMLYRTRPKAEKTIREYLINQNFVDAIILLPEKLFKTSKNSGGGTNVCVLILKKNKKNSNVFFIDASEQFEKIKIVNKLSEENIKWIVDTYRTKREIKDYSRMVEKKEIQEKDYNLSMNVYIRRERRGEEIDIEQLEQEIREGAERINRLRNEIDELVKTLKK